MKYLNMDFLSILIGIGIYVVFQLFKYLFRNYELARKKIKAMDLQIFISNSLTQIMNGIHDAQVSYGKDLNKKDEQLFKPLIAPTHIHGLEKNNTRIEFDISVTVISNKIYVIEGKANMKSGIGLDGKLNSENSNSSISRVKFSVPVIYPATPNNVN